jgi:retinol dehydrogenase-12
MMPPQGSKDAQGIELQLGTNCVGAYLFTKCLLPVLQKTVQDAPTGSVRVSWASSAASFLFSPTNGVTIDENGDAVQHSDVYTAYGQSKAGNNLLAAEFAKRYGKDGIISVSWNPGHLRSELGRHLAGVQNWFFENLAWDPIYGAYTELYAACSSDLTAENNGCYIAPWGRVVSSRADIAAAAKTQEEGGSGTAEKFWDWCEKVTKEHS